MSSVGQLLRLRLFLEGQEVPVVSANVHAAINSPATASIQVIATDRLHDLKARTLVHLFFYDSYEEEPLVPNEADPETVSAASQNVRAIGPRYKLLFAGELANVSFSRTKGSRSAILECVDFTAYWSQARHYFKEMFSLSSEQGRTANFVAASVSTYDSWFKSPGGEVIRALQTRPVTHKGMTGLLGGVVHLMEVMGGVYKGGKQFRGVNDFFNIAELRLHLMQMVGALEADDTSAKLLNHRKFRKYLTRVLQQLGATASFRDIINVVLQLIRHQTIPNPAAHYKGSRQVPPPEGSTVTKQPPAADRAILRAAAGHLTDAHRAARKGEEEASFLLEESATEDEASRLIRLIPPSQHGRAIQGTDNARVQAIRDHQLEIDSSLLLALEELEKLSAKTAPRAVSLRAEIEEKLRFDILARPARLSIATAIDELVDLSKCGRAWAKKAKNLNLGKVPDTKPRTKVPRLFSTLVLPDCWFVPPPRCNVLFPELYSTFNYSRNFMAEITRLQLTTTSEYMPIEAAGLPTIGLGTVKQIYHAPKIKKQVERTGSGAATRAARTLLPHEVFTGIVPHFEWMGNIKQMRVAEEGSKEYEKLGYAQRLANFLFFRRRFSARSLALQGKFNPHVVAGLPGLVIDRFLSEEQADLYQDKGLTEAQRLEKARGAVTPTQYLGKVSSVAHNVSQGGGATVVTMTQVRTHNESDEYLDADIRTVRKKTGTTKDPGSVTDNLGKGLSHIDLAIQHLSPKVVLTASAQAQAQAVGHIDLAVTLVRRAKSETRIGKIKKYCRKGLARLDRARSLADTSIVSEDSGRNSAFAVSELEIARKHLRRVSGLKSVGNYRSEATTVPPEEILRPPWFSSIYTNELIGEQVYQPLLGIDAITDALDVRTTAEDKAIKESERLREIADVLDIDLKGERTDEEARLYKDLLARSMEESMFANPVLESGSSIEEAVDHLVRSYAYTKVSQGQQSAHSFVRQYHRRPIATMLEVLGSDHELAVRREVDKAGFDAGRVVGFHENAYGDVDPMAGLTDKEWPPAEGKAPRKRVQGDLDPRRERYRAVDAYVSELRASSALRG